MMRISTELKVSFESSDKNLNIFKIVIKNLEKKGFVITNTGVDAELNKNKHEGIPHE